LPVAANVKEILAARDARGASNSRGLHCSDERLEFHVAMHNIGSLGIRRLSGLSERIFDMNTDHTGYLRVPGTVRTLGQREELPLLRDHLLRLDQPSRHDRFHGVIDDGFIERYAEKCAHDGTVVIAYIEDGMVRGAAELHPPGRSPDSQPEIAFSVEASVRRRGVGSILFAKLIREARAKGYTSLRITTGAQNEAMRALAGKFGAHLTFRRGESTGSIDLKQNRTEPARLPIEIGIDAIRAAASFNRAYWKLLLRMYGWGRTA
jgi:GNAT superfamily N-acetyltransferase